MRPAKYSNIRLDRDVHKLLKRRADLQCTTMSEVVMHLLTSAETPLQSLPPIEQKLVDDLRYYLDEVDEARRIRSIQLKQSQDAASAAPANPLL